VNLKQLIIHTAYKAKQGHIGSALSVVDTIDHLYSKVLRKDDVFILSKGHAALALYCVLYKKGIITKKQLDSYCQPGSLLQVHPDHRIKGIEFSTGSLGMGLSYGVGVALAKKIKKEKGQVYVLMSDAELNEGSVWEAAQFAGHNKLNNLIIYVDNNNQQAMGKSIDILNFEWVRMLHACGFNRTANSPLFYGLGSIFGHGVSFMENNLKWHYARLNEQEYKQAMKELA
jgi:transketolase